MLPFRVGAIDVNRPGAKRIMSRKVAVPAKQLYPPWVPRVWLLLILLSALTSAPYAAGQQKGHKKKARATATPSGLRGEQSLANIPLPIGHEAKGLVLPDFDSEGHLRGKFIASTARRIDEEHIRFQDLKITTFTPESQTDLQIDMQTSVFDLKTKILSSQERATV